MQPHSFSPASLEAHTDEPPPPYSPFDFDTIVEQSSPVLERSATGERSELEPRECGGPSSHSSTPDVEPIYTAISDFVAQSSTELSLAQGEIVLVIKKQQSGWWLVRRLIKPSEQGWVPDSYLQENAEPARPPPTPISPSTAQKRPSGFRSRIRGFRHSSDKVETIPEENPAEGQTKLRNPSSSSTSTASTTSPITPSSPISPMSSLGQSRSSGGQAGKLTFRPFHGFQYEQRSGR